MTLASRTRRFLPAVVCAIAAFVVVLPLLVQGCSCGHDFDFHVLSWMEAASQWQHGVVKPVWAFTPAYNAGEPRLLFYPPLSWATGALTGLFLPWTFAPIAFTWLVLFLSGMTMHRLLRRWMPSAFAILGGCLYLVNPYMLFCAYERTAYAELMAAAWMPLLIAAMLRPRVSLWRVALPVALLWLTNAPSAVVGLYSVVFLGVLRLIFDRREGIDSALRVTGTVTAGALLALLLDAFYLVPLASEQRFIQLAMAVVPIARPDHNFLFAYDKDVFHTHVLVQASWIAVGTIAAALLCGVALMFRLANAPAVRSAPTDGRDPASVPRGVVMNLTIFSLAVLFLLLPWSTPFWHAAPEVTFLQFPWRFLTVESAASIALLCLVLQGMLHRVSARVLLPAGVLIAALAGWFAGGVYFREDCADEETVQAQRLQYLHRSGVEPTDEYTPAIADNDELRTGLPPAWLASTADETPGTKQSVVTMDETYPEDLRFAAPAAKESFLILRVRKFPGWHVLRDGVEIGPETRDDGLMVIPVTPGKTHQVQVLYRTTRDQWAGLAVSGITMLGILAAGWRKRFGMMNHP